MTIFRRKREKETVAPEVLEELAEAQRARESARLAHERAKTMHVQATEIAGKLRQEREHNHFAERITRALGGGLV